MKLENKTQIILTLTLFFLQLDASTECDRYMGYASKERFVYFYSYILLYSMNISIATNLCFSSTKGLSKNIMLLPGHAFMPKNASESPKTINHMRAAFSVASEKDFDVAFERLAELIREEQANQKQ